MVSGSVCFWAEGVSFVGAILSCGKCVRAVLAGRGLGVGVLATVLSVILSLVCVCGPVFLCVSHEIVGRVRVGGQVCVGPVGFVG